MRIANSLKRAGILTLVLFLLPFTAISNISASGVSLADSADRFIVSTPSSNSVVRGNVVISFRAFDDEQLNINYNVRVLDAATCRTSNYGNINPGNSVPSNTNQNFSFIWNSTRTNSTSNLNDGRYCLKICTFLLNGNTPYSACNSRIVTVANNNRAPVINSTPQNLRFTEGQRFSYQINATDPDENRLRYRFVRTVDGFRIDNSGRVTNDSLSTFGLNAAAIPITVAVSDGVNPEVMQNFIIQVYSNTGAVTDDESDDEEILDEEEGNDDDKEKNEDEEDPTDEDNDTIDEDRDETEVDPDTENYKLIFPNENSTVTSDSMVIKWEFSSYEGIDTLELEYSSDQESWHKIGDEFSDLRNYYVWDIAYFNNGEYYIRLNIRSENQVQRIISDKFNIQKPEDKPISEDEEVDLESVPLIINLNPENNTEVESKSAQDFLVSGDFIPSKDSEIITESVVITLNGNDINEMCEIDKNGFLCNLKDSLNEGKHIAKVTVRDTNEKTTEAEWSFTIKSQDAIVIPTPENDSSEQKVIIFGREIDQMIFIVLLLILSIGLALLIIPWLLFAMWNRRNDANKESNNKLVEPIEALPNVNVYTPTVYEPVSQSVPQSSGTGNNYYEYQPTPINSFEYEVNNNMPGRAEHPQSTLTTEPAVSTQQNAEQAINTMQTQQNTVAQQEIIPATNNAVETQQNNVEPVHQLAPYENQRDENVSDNNTAGAFNTIPDVASNSSIPHLPNQNSVQQNPNVEQSSARNQNIKPITSVNTHNNQPIPTIPTYEEPEIVNPETNAHETTIQSKNENQQVSNKENSQQNNNPNIPTQAVYAPPAQQLPELPKP